MPIAIGIMPSNPMLYVGTSAIKEPSALIAISNQSLYTDLILLGGLEKRTKKGTS
jgi:hypothetical protein